MIVFLFVFGIFAMSLYIAWSEIDTAFTSAGIDDEGVVSEMFTAYQDYIDPLFLSIAIALWIGSLFLAYFISSHPIMFWAYWMVCMVGGITGVYLANAWIDLVASAPFNVLIADFAIMNYILSHYLIFLLVYGFSLLLVFFAKPGSMGGGTVETL